MIRAEGEESLTGPIGGEFLLGEPDQNPAQNRLSQEPQ